MSSRRILLIEDEHDARETLKDLLELEGFTVLTAEHGLQAMDLLNQGEQPCLVFLDLMMPVMNGWEFLTIVRNQKRDLLQGAPIVVLSAAGDVGPLSQSLGCMVMKKPADIDRLLSIAREHCQCC